MSVAVAHQHSPTGTIALIQAAREARMRQTELLVINIVDTLDLDSEEAVRAGLSEEIQRDLDNAKLSDTVWSLQVGAEDEDVASAVVALAVRGGAEVLVIGARRRSPVGKFLLGSATTSIILEAPMAVLVVKTPPAETSTREPRRSGRTG